MHDAQRGRWLAIDGPGVALMTTTDAGYAWAGTTLVFDIVDVGFSEPRPKVMTMARIEIDCAAARISRVVPFGPFTGNWPF